MVHSIAWWLNALSAAIPRRHVRRNEDLNDFDKSIIVRCQPMPSSPSLIKLMVGRRSPNSICVLPLSLSPRGCPFAQRRRPSRSRSILLQDTSPLTLCLVLCPVSAALTSPGCVWSSGLALALATTAFPSSVLSSELRWTCNFFTIANRLICRYYLFSTVLYLSSSRPPSFTLYHG